MSAVEAIERTGRWALQLIHTDYFLEWFTQVLEYVTNVIFIPAMQAIKENTDKVAQYASNNTYWVLSVAYFAWNPQAIFIALQCFLAFIAILEKLKRLLFG